MDENFRRRLAQLAQRSRDGIFGENVQKAQNEWDILSPQGINVFHRAVEDFYFKERNEGDNLIYQPANIFCQLLIVVYRDAKKHDEFVANEYLHAFIRDFDSVEGSCLYPQWEGLVKSAFSFKQSVNNPLLVEQSTFELFRAYNEFLNALLPYLIIGWRTALGKPYNTTIFKQPYGVKLNEFKQLANGDEGIFYIIFRIANHHLRNAIAHSNVWFDKSDNKVKYTDGKDTKTIYENDLLEVMAHLAIGSYLAQSYIAAMSAIAILESGSASDISKLPLNLVRLFHHTASAS